MQLKHYLALLRRSETALASAFREVADAHEPEVDVASTCRKLANQCGVHADRLAIFTERYANNHSAAAAQGTGEGEPDRLHRDLFSGTRSGPLALLRDLHDLYLMACECDISWTLIGQGAQGARDEELLALVHTSENETATQIAWLRTRMKAAAPQALVVA